jgi:hypothetical protein
MHDGPLKPDVTDLDMRLNQMLNYVELKSI